MAFKIPFIDVTSFTKGYFQDIPNFRWADVTEKEEIGKGSFGSVMKANYVPDKKTVVVKRFFGEGESNLKVIAKEAKMLKDGCSGGNIHLRCFDHAQDDISRHLKSMKVNSEQRKKITTEILGREYNGKRVKGLVDCDTAEEFEKMYVEKENDWPEDFKKWILTEKGRIRSLKETLKECMLRPVRIAAGLGDPPKQVGQPEDGVN